MTSALPGNLTGLVVIGVVMIIAVAVLMVAFVRRTNPQIRPSLDPGEHLRRAGPANAMRGAEGVGGRLFLTDRRLRFTAHRMNVQTQPFQLDLAELRHARTCWTRLFNRVPVFPNGLAVTDTAGNEYRFAVYRPGAWAHAINSPPA